MSSPTQRTLKLMRDHGFYCEIVEHYSSFTRRKSDLFGFADVICMQEGHPPTLIQVTSTSNVASRITKIREEPRALLALKVGFRILVHGWAKRVDEGGWGTAEKVWVPKVYLVSLADFTPDVVDDRETPTG